jgi:2-oxoglutarate decarboxylase
LVEEMYRKFREDPSSVDPSWHEFLVDYSPEPTTDTASGGHAQPTTVTAPAAKSAEATTEPAAKPDKSLAPDKPEAAVEAKAPAGPAPAEGDEVQVLRGAAAAVVKNMSASLDVPTATSVRAIPAKLMIDNRIVINNHLKRTRGGKISFTTCSATPSSRRSRSSPT